MTIKKQGLVTAAATTRRQFTGLLCGSGLLTLAGCGGGSDSTGAQPVSSPTPATPATPPITATPVVTPAISWVAGGLGGISLLEGNGTNARIERPDNVAVSKDGVVYFSCGILCGKVSAQGDVSFIGNFPYMTVSGMACDSKGDLYACAAGVGVIYKLVNGVFSAVAGQYSPYPGGGFVDGVGQAALLKLPSSPAFDAQDNLYFIDRDNHAIRKVTPAGAVTTLAGAPTNLTMVDGKGNAAGFAAPRKLLVLNDGSLLVLDGTRWRKVLSDGTVSTLAGTVPDVRTVVGVDVNALYALLGNSVVKLALDGSTVNVAGSQAESGYVDGLKDAARFNAPASLAMALDGQLFVADQDNALIRRVDPASGQVSAWVGAAPQPGHLDGDGAQARFAAMGANCVDREGNIYVINKVYVIDTLMKTLRKVTPTGTTSTLFNDFPADGGVAVDANGNFYGVRNRAIIKVSPSGGQQVWAGQTGVLGYADGAGAAASFARPLGLVFDAQGNLLVGDSPDKELVLLTPFYTCTYGSTIRKITPAGVVSTVAGVPGRTFTDYQFFSPTVPFPNLDVTFLEPTALACDANGKVWVLDAAGVRRIDAEGAAPVWLWRKNGLTSMVYAAGSPGDVYVSLGNAISKLSADGTQTVVVGVDAPYRNGVQLGALPGRLGQVSSIVASAANVLYCCAENSVLKIQLA